MGRRNEGMNGKEEGMNGEEGENEWGGGRE